MEQEGSSMKLEGKGVGGTSVGGGDWPRARPIISFRSDGLYEGRRRPNKPQEDCFGIPTVEDAFHGTGERSGYQPMPLDPEAAVCSPVLHMGECDDFYNYLADFEREIRGLTGELATERHLQEKEVVATHASRGTSVSQEGRNRESLSPSVVPSSKTTAVVGRNAPHHIPPPASMTSFPSRGRATEIKKTGVRSPQDASCLHEIALNVWATLGFFSLPPIEVDSEVKPVRSEERWRAPFRDFLGSSSPPADAFSEDEESIFLFVAALERFYQRLLASGEVSLGKRREKPKFPKEMELTEEMLRYGLWHVLFNACFYCISIPSAERRFTSRDLECFSSGAEGCCGVVYASSSPSSGESGDEEEGDDKKVNCSHLPVGLQWHADQIRNEKNRMKPIHSEPQHSLTPDMLRRYRRYTELDETKEERRDTSRSSAVAAEQEFERTTSASNEDASKREDLLERLRRGATPFSGRFEVPPPIMSWYFVVRTLSQIGYTRDSFFVQTPLHGSLHELLLALLWLTKEYHLVALAEHVQLQRMYSFLLQQAPVTCDGTNGGDHRVYETPGECTAEVLKNHKGAVLLHCFPEAVPWPPASFIEEEHIAHRLEQMQQILPVDLEGGDTSAMRPPDLVRRLLSMRRLVDLSLNRLESALHQRAEQIVSLGLHSDLDVQICCPEYHNEYRQLCSGLQHLRGMEARLRNTTQQLSNLGSLVAWALQEEVVSEQQQRLDAVIAKSVEDDESTWIRQGIHNSHEQQLVEGEDGNDVDGVCVGWRMRDVINNFHATGMQEYLRDLWASIRRSAQVSGGTGGVNHRPEIEFVAMQTQLEEQVQQNMATRYSLDAALKAELWTWQNKGVGTIHGTADGWEPILERLEEKHQRSLQRLRDGYCGADPEVGKRSNVRRKRPCVSFDLLLGSIGGTSRRPQATAVGRPAEGATTSARLEMERLRKAQSSLQQLQECLSKHEEDRNMVCKALEVLQRHNLRVVHRNRR